MNFCLLRAMALAGLFATAAVPALAADADPVVATVNGHDIHRSAVLKAKDALGRHGQVPIEHLYHQLLDQMITDQLVLDQANKQKIEDDPEFKTAMAEARRQVLMQVYLTRQAGAEIPESAIKQRYDETIAAKPAKEEVKVRHILVKTEDDAKAVIADLNAGTPFDEEAKAKSIDPQAKMNGGEAGYITKEKAIPEFSAAAFKLKPGEYTKDPVQSQFGWHVIKVEDRRLVPPPSYEDSKADIKSELVEDQTHKIVADLQKSAKITRFNLDGTPLGDAPKQ